jgi:hypothetical protein
MEIGSYIELKRTLRKPYPIKGAWSEKNGFKGASPATRAIITRKGKEWYEVQVYHLRGAWFESSEESDDIKSLEEAKQWLVEHYGGKWIND